MELTSWEISIAAVEFLSWSQRDLDIKGKEKSDEDILG
jgi:hypothetical protein